MYLFSIPLQENHSSAIHRLQADARLQVYEALNQMPKIKQLKMLTKLPRHLIHEEFKLNI